MKSAKVVGGDHQDGHFSRSPCVGEVQSSPMNGSPFFFIVVTSSVTSDE
jgi:hypothetical protein